MMSSFDHLPDFNDSEEVNVFALDDVREPSSLASESQTKYWEVRPGARFTTMTFDLQI